MVQVKTTQLTFSGDFDILNDAKKCDALLDDIIAKAGLTTLRSLHHEFEPQGVSIIKLLAESHIALHTWPETNQGYVTLTTCSGAKLDEAVISNVLSKHNLTVSQIALVMDGPA